MWHAVLCRIVRHEGLFNADSFCPSFTQCLFCLFLKYFPPTSRVISLILLTGCFGRIHRMKPPQIPSSSFQTHCSGMNSSDAVTTLCKLIFLHLHLKARLQPTQTLPKRAGPKINSLDHSTEALCFIVNHKCCYLTCPDSRGSAGALNTHKG